MKTTKQYKVTTRFVLLFGTLLLLTNIILGVVMMNFSRNAVRDLVRKNMLDIATTAADLVDGDALGALTEDDVGKKNRDEACIGKLSELNPYVKVSLLNTLFSLLHKQLSCSKFAVVFIGHSKHMSNPLSF